MIRRRPALLALVVPLLVVPAASPEPVAAAAQVSERSRDCDDLRAARGITDRAVTISVVADVSGPVPGLHQSAADAVAAFVTYFNASDNDGICGRRLELKTYDSRSDPQADRQATSAACGASFAAIGSMSVFDSAGASKAQSCGLPDLRVRSSSKERRACTTCFDVHPLGATRLPAAIPDRIVEDHPRGSRKVALLWLDAGNARSVAKREQNAWKRRGVRYVYSSASPAAGGWSRSPGPAGSPPADTAIAAVRSCRADAASRQR